MIAKVRHLVQVVGEHQFEEHRLADRHINDEDADKRLVRNLIFEAWRIKAEDIPEDAGKTPDFRLPKDGALHAYCEMKAPTDGDLFDVPDDLAPGEVCRKDPAIFNLARHIAKAAKQFDAANPDRAHPNILIFVNHARRKGPANLRMALEGIQAPDGGRLFPVNDADKSEVQNDVWEAACAVDLYVWVDAKKRTWQAFHPARPRRWAEACDRFGMAPAQPLDSARISFLMASRHEPPIPPR
jgi:hypothetical protein